MLEVLVDLTPTYSIGGAISFSSNYGGEFGKRAQKGHNSHSASSNVNGSQQEMPKKAASLHKLWNTSKVTFESVCLLLVGERF